MGAGAADSGPRTKRLMALQGHQDHQYEQKLNLCCFEFHHSTSTSLIAA